MRCATNLVGLSLELRRKLTQAAGSMRTASIHPTIPSIAWPTNPVLVPKCQGRPQSGKSNATLSTSGPNHDGDDYGYDDIDDSEIFQTVVRAEKESFTDIDELMDVPQATFGTQLKEPERSPGRLPNGKYSCHHHCKDKNRCKHPCCREGVNKQRKKTKPRTDHDFEFPHETEPLTTGSRQLPLSFAGMTPIVDLTQRERPEWKLTDSEAGSVGRGGGNNMDRGFASQRPRAPNPWSQLRNTPFKIPAFKEPARLESQQHRTAPTPTQVPNVQRPPWTSPSTALPPAASRPHHLDRETREASQAPAFAVFDDGDPWPVIDATQSGRNERADRKRRPDDAPEPASPARSGRSKAPRAAAGVDRAGASSPMFVPPTPGPLASPPRGDVAANDPPPGAVARPRALAQVRPAAPSAVGAARPAARPEGRAFVNVHSMAQPVDSNKENEVEASQVDGENDALRKLREWLGDCVEFE
jgi:hypothetical protein